MTDFYAGIGARATPQVALDTIKHIARFLALDGYALRSGAAEGADTAFEEGCDSENGWKEIYLPWPMFRGHTSPLYGVSDEALELAKKHHPNWNSCSKYAQLFHGRNCYQVLGIDLKTPAKMVVCWTPEGKVVGGTGQAIRLAQAYEIPVINLGDSATYADVLGDLAFREMKT